MERLLFAGFCEKAIVDSHSSHVTEGFSSGQRSARASLLVGGDAGLWLAASLCWPTAAFSAVIGFNWCVLWWCISESIMDNDQKKNQRKKVLDHNRTRARVRTSVYHGQFPFFLWSFRETDREREQRQKTQFSQGCSGNSFPGNSQESEARTANVHVRTAHTQWPRRPKCC